jgi:sugar lactone lactonase YvrE
MMMMQLVAAISLVFYSSPTSAAQSLRQVDKRAVDVIIATFTGISDGHYGGVDIHSSGDIYLGDYQNKVIKHIDGRTGVTSIIAGTGHEDYNGDGLRSLSTNICSPLGVAVDESRNVYFTDFDNNRVRMISSSTGLVTTVVGTGEAGYNGDGFSSSSATLTNPVGVALDGQGNLYVADSGNHRVRRVDLSSLEISTIAGTDQIGYNGDDIAATSATLNSPHSIAFDPVGNIYFTDRLNNRIRKINSETGVISTVAGTGVAGYSSNDVVATSAMLHLPRGIAFDESANLYIEDGEDNRVRNINAATGIMTTLFQKDSTSYKLERIPAIFATMTSPSDLEESSSGSLFVTEHYLKTVSLSRVLKKSSSKSKKHTSAKKSKHVPSAAPVQHASSHSHSKKTHSSGEHFMASPSSPPNPQPFVPPHGFFFPPTSAPNTQPFVTPFVPPHGFFFPPTSPPINGVPTTVPSQSQMPSRRPSRKTKKPVRSASEESSKKHTTAKKSKHVPSAAPVQHASSHSHSKKTHAGGEHFMASPSSPPNTQPFVTPFVPPHGFYFPPTKAPNTQPFVTPFVPPHGFYFPPTKAPNTQPFVTPFVPPHGFYFPPTSPPINGVPTTVPSQVGPAPTSTIPTRRPSRKTKKPNRRSSEESSKKHTSAKKSKHVPSAAPVQHSSSHSHSKKIHASEVHFMTYPYSPPTYPPIPPLETIFPTCGYPISPPTYPTEPPTCGSPTTVPTLPTSPPTCGSPTTVPTLPTSPPTCGLPTTVPTRPTSPPTCGLPTTVPTLPTSPPTCGSPTTVPTLPTSPPTCGLPTSVPTMKTRRPRPSRSPTVQKTKRPQKSRNSKKD